MLGSVQGRLVRRSRRVNIKSDREQDNSSPIHLRSAAPTFAVADVGETARWYVENLGFEIAGNFPDKEPFAYVSLQRDALEIMLLRIDAYQKPDLTKLRSEGVWDAYIRLRGIRGLYESVAGKDFVCMPLKKQPYGDTEFEVQDPNGYILVFGELIEET